MNSWNYIPDKTFLSYVVVHFIWVVVFVEVVKGVVAGTVGVVVVIVGGDGVVGVACVVGDNVVVEICVCGVEGVVCVGNGEVGYVLYVYCDGSLV